MPKRVSLSEREAGEGQGRRAFDAAPTTSTDGRKPSTVDRLPAGWEARHKRVTFYCPDDVLEAVEREVARSGRSKTRVIVDALREHLV